MSTFEWIPDYDAEEDVTTAVISAKFGDGYEQRVGDGLNSIKTSWNLTFSLRTKAQVVAIAAFLKDKKGVVSFLWAPPGEATKRFKCVAWKRRLRTDFDSALTCTFEEVFEP